MEEDPAGCVLAGGAMSKLAAKLDGLQMRSQGRRGHRPIPWEVKSVLIPVIKQNLESMMAIIQDDGDDNSSRAVIRCLTKEVRELSYDIHDCIDEHTAGPASDHATRLLWRMERHVRVAKGNDKRRRSTVLRAPRRTSRKPVTSCWLSERLKGRLWLLDKMREFRARSEEALHRYMSFHPPPTELPPPKKQRNDHNYGDGSTSASATRSVESFGSWSPLPYTHVLHRPVGIHDLAMNTLKAWLTDEDSPKLKVVSMVGCGGVGKTTLANELYLGIGGQFEYRAFVRTSQKTDVRSLLISILSQIRPRQAPGNWKVHDLIGNIRTHLQDRRYLIVIDDVWARSTWDIVNRAFPDGNHCSRILITSELEDVALKCCGYEPQYVYKMKPLGEDDSRQLFYSIVGCSQELSEVSNSIIRKCGGLPLAIVTIASLLASRMGKPEQREYVDKSLGYGLMTNPTFEGMKQVVNLSYRNLPQHLKACLLYLCIFPEDYIIWTDDLVKQWIAEGFICASENKDEEEISRSYFDELIFSRLIHPIHIDGNGKVLSCTMHPMMRNHIMHESLVENFVAAIDNSQTATRFTHKVRRLSLHFGNAEDATLSTNTRLSQVRTLAFFGAVKCVPSITEFRLLQVLILHFWGEEESIGFDLTSISEIFRLRYLQVTCNVTLEIQQMQMLRRLQYLETLKIDAATGSRIPWDSIHLPRLLHLRLPAGTNLLTGVGHMTSLRTLGHFDLSTNSIDNVQDLGELINVQDLHLTCTPVGHPGYLLKEMECLSSVLEKLNNLKCLTLKNSRLVDLGHRPSSMSISCDVLSSVSSPPALLQRLEWLPRSCTFSSLPEWIGHLGNLCILKIGVWVLVRNDVDLLKGLPALTDLSLYVRTKPAEIIVFNTGGFLVLKYFRFRCSVPCLKFETNAMPNLQKLKLAFDVHRTVEYSLIPDGLDYLSGLKEISAKIGVTGANELYGRIVESALSDAIRTHPGRPTVNIQCVDQIFGDKDDENISLQEEKHMTKQKQYELTEEDSDEQHVTLQKGSREDPASSSRVSGPTLSVRTSVLHERHMGETMGSGIPDVALQLVMGCVEDRDAISLVCRHWCKVDALTRKHVTVDMVYSTTPALLFRRFPCLESLKLKGKPRAVMFGLIPNDWGGSASLWIRELSASFHFLKVLHLRRMVVSDDDLAELVRAKAHMLVSLMLDRCSGFSTPSLALIARCCKKLETLILEESDIAEKQNDKWLHELATSNTVLETLNFSMTELKASPAYLVLVVRNCSRLKTLKIDGCSMSDLIDLFHTAKTLQDFAGLSFEDQDQGGEIIVKKDKKDQGGEIIVKKDKKDQGGEIRSYETYYFPPSIQRLSLLYMGTNDMQILFPYGSALKKLDLQYTFLTTEDHCQLVQRCPNLEVLEVTSVIGDQGLEVVAQTCKKLQRLRVERGDDSEEGGRVTQVGLMAVAQGCPDLQYWAGYVSDITNAALRAIGRYSQNLNDFRLVLLDRENIITELPLDNGVRDLLRGCTKLRRFVFYVRPGALSDIGLSYVGEFSKTVRHISLGYPGSSNDGLLALARGCPSLQKLELRNCCFSERAIAIAALQLKSLRYLWVHGYNASPTGTDLMVMARPFWNIEFTASNQGEGRAQFLAYYSLAGARTDCPQYVIPLYPPV